MTDKLTIAGEPIFNPQSISALEIARNNPTLRKLHDGNTDFTEQELGKILDLKRTGKDKNYILKNDMDAHTSIQNGLNQEQFIALAAEYFDRFPRGSKKITSLVFDSPRLPPISEEQKTSPVVIDTIPSSLNPNPGRSVPPGFHTVNSSTLGRHLTVFEKYAAFAMKNPAFLRFGSAFYLGDPNFLWNVTEKEEGELTYLCMIPFEKRELADQISKKLYQDQIGSNDVHWIKPFWPRGGGTSAYLPIGLTPWRVEVKADIRGLVWSDRSKKKPIRYYTPPYIVALHEIGHAERMKPLQMDYHPNYAGSSISEIAPVLDQIIRSDAVYKQIYQIPLDQEVEYPVRLITDKDPKGLNLGRIANVFRKLLEKFIPPTPVVASIDKPETTVSAP